MSAPGRSLLSRPEILRHMGEGNVVIEPFDPACVNTASVDLRLGPHFFREQRMSEQTGQTGPFNPFDAEHIARLWGRPQRAIRAGPWMRRNGVLTGVRDEDFLIVLAPGETILAHTIEFIGGRRCVTTEMRARSSLGRIGLTVCKCAGWGDVGYTTRWTMEMTNHLRDSSIVLVVGMRVAQLAFYQVDPVDTSYAGEGGKYQAQDDLRLVMEQWRPEMMLPMLYKDRDVGHFARHIPSGFEPFEK